MIGNVFWDKWKRGFYVCIDIDEDGDMICKAVTSILQRHSFEIYTEWYLEDEFNAQLVKVAL